MLNLVPSVQQSTDDSAPARRSRTGAATPQRTAANHRDFEAAVPAGADPREYARLLGRIRDAALSGGSAPAAPRALVNDSWQRTLDFGMDPDHGRTLPDAADQAEVEHRRESGKLARVLPVLGDVLLPAAEDAGHVMVIVDAQGMILWQDGPPKIRQHAERLGFQVGANWSERTVGTNAIGTALVLSRPVQIYSAEHFVRTHHSWTCAAAPILDPVNGDLLGVVDVSGAASTVHPSTLALVDAAARMAESFLREEHHAALNTLRSNTSHMLRGSREHLMVTDTEGWVAASTGGVPLSRVALPQQRDSDRAWLPAFGSCRLEPVDGGWLIEVLNDEVATATSVVLDLRDSASPTVQIVSQAGRSSHRLTPRHSEILLLLAVTPRGLNAVELSRQIYGSADHVVAVRSEISRLRRYLTGSLLQRPYRLADWVEVSVRYPDDPADLLPASLAPTIRRLRYDHHATA